MSIWRMRLAILLIIMGLLMLAISYLITSCVPKRHLYQENTISLEPASIIVDHR